MQQLLVVAAASPILALGHQPVLGPEAASVLAVPEEGLVVQLQVAQGLALLLRLQRAELEAARGVENGVGPDRARPRDAIFPSLPGPTGVAAALP